MIKRTIQQLLKDIKRGWKIYMFPPKETKIFFNPKAVEILSEKIATAKTGAEPKQAAVDVQIQRAYVACMKAQVLQEFSFADNRLEFVRQWRFPEQCVEVEFSNKLCYLTTTNFRRVGQKSHLRIFDPIKGEEISSLDTRGEWSKVIKIDEIRGVAYISNWHSHDLSTIDVKDPKNSKVIQVLACGESPRGLALRPDGVAIATSFYGRKIFSVEKIDGEYKITKESPRFDQGAYGGNMRDVIITADGNIVWVSNLGRNMLHWYDAYTLKLLGSILVPRQPNSIRFLDETEQTILVSCRKDNVVCFIDAKEKRPIGVSQKTGKFPTGLAVVKDGFLVTSFDSNTIELHSLIGP